MAPHQRISKGRRPPRASTLVIGAVASFFGTCVTDIGGVRSLRASAQLSRPRASSRILAALSDDESDENNGRSVYERGNVLAAEESMFKPPSTDSDRCTWPVLTVDPCAFTFQDGRDIHLPNAISLRSFEYGSSWVEHYYQPLIRECKEQNRLGIIRALYQWYTAQFTLDYLQEQTFISKEVFLYSSYQHDDKSCFDGAGGTCEEVKELIEGCRSLMVDYTNTMKAELPSYLLAKIQEGTATFYRSSVEQITGACLEENMSLEEYVRFRAVNAGGMFGFVEQCHLLQWLHPRHEGASHHVLKAFADNVGMHVALLNDLYGLDRDAETGDLNIVLRYASEKDCGVGEAVRWAVERLQRCASNVRAICDEHPNSIPSEFDVGIECVAGNHGFHEVSKRYKLPDGFIWPDSCVVDIDDEHVEGKALYEIF
mmetsp:Transcript_22377/g.48159  ORF Transcript_22377/g.48159 Transcript_22377/m.48159 type:complete len:427 (-) Transcript_22377:1260-2540(-)